MIFITLGFLLLVFLLIKYQLDYWKRKGVKYAKTLSPFGNIWQNVLERKSLQYIIQDMYDQFPDEPFFGIFTFLTPTLIIRDPELYKNLAVKNADVFLTHKLFSTDEESQAFSKNIFVTDAKTWKAVRPTLSPGFTGSKMRTMYTMIMQCGQQWEEEFAKEITEEVTTLDIREDVIIRFTIDVIAHCIFGLDINSFKNKENEFFERAKETSDFGGSKVYALFGYCINKYIVKLLNLSIIAKDDEQFFANTVLNTIKYRKENKVVRPDMLHLFMQAQQGKMKQEKEGTLDNTGFATVTENAMTKAATNVEITDEDIVGHSLLLLIAGADTAACNINFLMHEIVTHKDIQERLYEEIHEAMEESGGKLSYEKLIGLKYIDMVCSESLRKWPPLPLIDRVSTRPFTINHEGKSVHLGKNAIIWVPIMCIHRDPKYYPEPEKFDPERFSDENKDKINKDHYIPFGSGPRACIGSRLAILMIKSLVVQILSKYEMVEVEKTPNDLKLSKKHIFLNSQKPVYVGLKKRSA